MTKNSLGVAVIGTGFFGEVHAATYASMSSANLVAVCDVDEQRAKAVAARYDAEAYTDYREVLRRDDVHLVSIVTPEAFHREPAVDAARAGKHVFCEKPIATTTADADAIITAAEDNGVKLTVGFESRFLVGTAQIKAAIDEGNLGDLSLVYSRRRGDRGFADIKRGRVSPVKEIAIHDIDLFLWFTQGDPITEVRAVGVNRAVYQQWGVPDWVILTLRTRGGTVGVIDCGWGLPYKWTGWSTPSKWHPYADTRTEVIGTSGAVYLDLHPMMVRGCDEVEGWKFPDTVYWPDVHGSVAGAIRTELDHFIDCVQRDREPLVTGRQAREALRIAQLAERALEEDVPVLTTEELADR